MIAQKLPVFCQKTQLSLCFVVFCQKTSVAFFWFPGSGSGTISHRYGSGSFYHQAKIIRKTLIPTVFWLFIFEKNYVNLPSKSTKHKNFFLQISLLLASWRSVRKLAGSESGSIRQRHESAGPDPDWHQIVIDPQHCKNTAVSLFAVFCQKSQLSLCLLYFFAKKHSCLVVLRYFAKKIQLSRCFAVFCQKKTQLSLCLRSSED